MKKQETKRKKAVHAVIITLALFAFAYKFKAQDKIYFHNGDGIFAKVIEVNDTEIKYKAHDNLSGPLHIILRSDVRLISYENGIKEVFGNEHLNPVTVTPHLAKDTDNFMPPKSRTFAGPRFGFTYITVGTIADKLSKDGKNPVITQFGWQFETRMFSIQDGTQGIVEFIPLIGGMEQGTFLPSANLLIGLRGGGERAYEFALGPNLSLAGLGMVFAAGANFRSGYINFPVNIAFVPSVNHVDTYQDASGAAYKKTIRTGFRISLTVGFNMRKT